MCSDCFYDQGLRLDAAKIGVEDGSPCPACGSETGRKLNADLTAKLA
jgi:hypothetical protein